ncbi:hypothetical protein Sste5346_006336 [Sporothrix stenoceras]|uniref:Uncharacterized protein n=1 Tax=Sporothrix stenoceras TaxID=5173 RepID=A0ABR3YZ38_9PEZI
MKSNVLWLVALAPSTLASLKNLCDTYGYYANYTWYINNNEWGASSGTGSQCTYVDSANTGGVSWHTDWTWSGGTNNVKSYPYSGRDLTVELVSDISQISNSVQWSYTGTDIRADVAYDMFSAANKTHNTSSGDYELMIWLGRYGGVQPRGSAQSNVTIAGLSWEFWLDDSTDMTVYSFVAASTQNSFSSDIKLFWNYVTQNHNFPASTQYLISMYTASIRICNDLN